MNLLCLVLQMTELLSKAGATIQELNMCRKFFSQTKGGKLAEAAYPAQVSFNSILAVKLGMCTQMLCLTPASSHTSPFHRHAYERD